MPMLISLVPAIYYAHLASNRARSHESVPASAGPRGGQKFEEANADRAVRAAHGLSADGTSQTGTSLPAEALPLVPMGAPENPASMLRIRTGMWYI
jgi:eukaryotic translation initiation factor 2C